MNCDLCGMTYKPPVAHPPTACIEYAAAALKKAYEALDADLTQIAKLWVERRGFQLMAIRMFDLTRAELWQGRMEEGKYWRAGGDVECTLCRRPYMEHPELPGFATFHMLCSGEIVKT